MEVFVLKNLKPHTLDMSTLIALEIIIIRRGRNPYGIFIHKTRLKFGVPFERAILSQQNRHGRHLT